MKVESFNIISEWDGKYKGFLNISDGEGSNASVVVPDAICREIIESRKWDFEALFSAKRFDYAKPCVDSVEMQVPQVIAVDESRSGTDPRADDEIPF